MNPPGSKNKKLFAQGDEDSDVDDDMDEDSVDSYEEAAKTAAAKKAPEPPRKEPKSAFEGRTAAAEDKIAQFLDDPATALKLFFTHYSYERGMVW